MIVLGDIILWKEKYKNHFFLKQANLIGRMTKQEILKKMPWFFPKRKTFLAFLHKLKKENPFLFKELLDISLRSDFMYNSLENQEKDNIDPDVRNKETWEELCTIPENPKTGSNSLYIAAVLGIVTLIIILIVSKKSNKIYKI